MATLIPVLTSSVPNPNVAYNNAWVSIENQSNRPLFAQATYIANASDLSLSLSAASLNVNLQDVENLVTENNILVAGSNTLLNDLTGKTSFGTSSAAPSFVYQGDLNYTTDSVSVSVLNLSVDLINSNFGKNGFTFITSNNGIINGNFVKVQVVSACKILSLTATNSQVNSLVDFELPIDFSFNAPITQIGLKYGAVIVYKS